MQGRAMLAPANWASPFGEAFLFSAEKLIQCIHPQHEDAEDEEDPRHTGAEHREGDGQQSS